MISSSRTKYRRRSILILVAICGLLALVTNRSIKQKGANAFSQADLAQFVARLESAEHLKAHTSALEQSIRITKDRGIKKGALNALGMEVRDVRNMVNGQPEGVFVVLSFLGGYGEIVWVDAWTSFPVNLSSNAVPRREAVRAALEAVQAAGASIIDAGDGRHVIVRNAEVDQFDAAVDLLGWRDGVAPPWEENGQTGE